MRSRFSNDTHGAGDAVLQCCSVAGGDSTHFFLRFRLSTAGSGVRQS